MFKSKKVVTVGKISEFLNPVQEIETTSNFMEQQQAYLDRNFWPINFLPFTLLPAFFDGFAVPTFAAGNETAVTAATTINHEVQSKIMAGFDPIIDLVSGLAYPLAFIGVTYAGILYMLKRPEEALDKIKHTALGFVLVNMAPLLMKLLVSVTAGF
ncbi:hypothetical protein CPT_Silence37 [Bacillus phage Silence]|nr:hypothetical protein CPT_Silence37 [Bacillus phage Silence]